MKLEQGRPLHTEGRSSDETAVYDLLDQLNIEYERVDHAPADTMELCRAVDEVLAPAVICKNIFLCNTQKTRFYLLLLREDRRFVTKIISRQLNSSRLSFAPEEKMLECLHTPQGSASILGLMNDTEHQVQLAVDRAILESEWFGCHPCRNTSSLRLKTKDVFEVFLKHTDHTWTVVDPEAE